MLLETVVFAVTTLETVGTGSESSLAVRTDDLGIGGMGEHGCFSWD
jgi:hypothetical protein